MLFGTCSFVIGFVLMPWIIGMILVSNYVELFRIFLDWFGRFFVRPHQGRMYLVSAYSLSIFGVICIFVREIPLSLLWILIAFRFMMIWLCVFKWFLGIQNSELIFGIWVYFTLDDSKLLKIMIWRCCSMKIFMRAEIYSQSNDWRKRWFLDIS